MNLEDNFKKHSKKYLFSNDEFLSKQRENIFNKIILNNFDKKNNESLKNITMSDLILFDYCYNPSVEKPSVILVEKENYKINIVNGLCKNYEDNNIEIRNITTSDSKRFRDQNFENSEDIVIDFNRIFLNSIEQYQSF